MKMQCHFEGQKITYHLRRGGAGKPIFLLHGFCEDHRIWQALLPHLPDVAIYALDLPGFGKSPAPKRTDMHFWAQCVQAVMADVGVEKPHLIGHSLGGYLGLECLAAFSSQLAGLTLLHSHAWEDSPERLEARQKAISVVGSGKKSLYVQNLFAGLFAPHFAAENEGEVQRCTAMGQQQTAAGITVALRLMMERRNHLATLENAPLPVQFILGKEDALIPVSMGLDMGHRPAFSDVIVLEGVGHMGMVEAPEKVGAAIGAFYALLQS